MSSSYANSSERSNLLFKNNEINNSKNNNEEKSSNENKISDNENSENNYTNSINNKSEEVKHSESNENNIHSSSKSNNLNSEEQSLFSNQKLEAITKNQNSSSNKSNSNSEEKETNKKSTSYFSSEESEYENISNELENFKTKIKCSYYEYGNYPIYQRIYYCDVCDPNSTEKICEECYKTCHGKCGGDETESNYNKEINIKTKKNIIIIDEEEINKKNENKYFSFICSCGLKRHILNQKDEYIKFNYCVFLELDIKLHNKAVYSCESCGLTNLCYICYLKCHGGKSNCQIHKSISNNPNINKNKICLCNNKANHCNRIILNKFMNYIFNSQSNYDTIPFVWKGQILNCVFDGSIYELLYEKVYSFILSYHLNVTKFDEKKVDDSTIDTLARFVINITKTKKFYYLHENLIKVIPMSNLILLINSFKDAQLIKFAPFISGLLQLFLVLHLKRDFQEVKSLCYRDFLLTNVLERINMKLNIKSNSLYTKKIYSKYTSDNNFIIPQICIDFCGILNRAVEVFEENSYDKLIINYLVILEIIYFCVKRFLFEKKDLMKLTKCLEKFSISFNTMINLLLKNSSDSNNFNAVRKAVDYFSKIIYIIMVNFNDIIMNEKLNEKKINDNEDNLDDENTKFIHFNSLHSKILFKMFISTSIVFNTFILNSTTEDNNHLKNNKVLDMIAFTNKILETFTLSDNLYFKKMNEIQIAEFEDIEEMREFILNREKYEEELEIEFVEKRNFIINKDKIDYIIENDIYKMAVSYKAEKNLQNSMLFTTYNTKVRLESLLNLYFCSKIEYEQLDKKFYDILKEFGRNWNEKDKKVLVEQELEKIEKKSVSILKNKKTCYEPQTNNYKTDFPLIREKLIKDYLKQITKLIKKYFPNLILEVASENVNEHDKQHYKYHNSKYKLLHTKIIVRELIISGFDNTLTKLFIIDPVMKRYSQETIEIIFHFLLFYTMTKESLLHLLVGRNLSRIIEIFKSFPKLTLYFLVFISKGIYLYDIDLNNHKQIPNLLNLIYIYIRDNIDNYDVEHNENNIQDCIIYTMDILYYLSFSFEIESLLKINVLIVNEITKLINKNKVIQMFPFEKIVNKYMKMKKNDYNESEEKENEEEEEEENETEKEKLQLPYLIKEDKTYSVGYIKKLFTIANKKQINKNFFPFREHPFNRKKYQIINSEEKEKFKSNLFSNQNRESIFKMRRSSLFYTTLQKNNNNLISTLPKLNLQLQAKKTESFVKLKDSINKLSHSVISEEKSNNESNESSESFPKIDSNDEDKISEVSHKHFGHYQSQIILHSQKLFFSLIKLLSNITYFFVKKNNVFNTFLEINDLKFYQLLLSENYLTLKDRTILLVFIRMVYINDQIEEDNTLFLNKFMNSQEYSKYLGILRNLIEDDRATYLNIPMELLNDLTESEKIKNLEKLKSINAFNRFENLNNLKIVIEIFIHEIQNLLYYIYIEDDIDDINTYLRELLTSIKIISDVFITYDISSHMTLWLYELTKEFLNKIEFFINYFNNIKEKLFINNIDIGRKSIKIEEMEKKSFDIYDIEKIYGIILEAFQEIYDNTNFNQNFKLNTFITNYYNRDEKNFKNFTLNKTEIPFYNFEHEENQILTSDQIKTENKDFKTFSENRNLYLKQFNNFFQTTFYDLICCSSYDLSFNYNQLFLNYCVVYTFNLKNLSNENMITFLTMLNKLLIYEPSETQKSLFKIFEQKNKIIEESMDPEKENKIIRYEEHFFNNLGIILKEKININIVTSKNIVIYNRYEEINYTTKILIQFFQLLGECHNKSFHNLIITGKINENSNNKCINIFNTMCFTLGHIINCFDRYQSLIMKSELPFDKLIVLALNIISFIIEYFQGTSLEKYKIMYDTLKQIFPSIKSFLFYKNKNDQLLLNKNTLNNKFYKEKRNFIYTMKINLLDMLSSLIEEGNADNPSLNTINDILENFSPVDLYEDGVNSFIYMNNTLRELKNYSIDNEEILPILMDLYKYNDNFQDSIELKWALRIFYYLRVLSDNYGRVEVKSFLESFKHIYLLNKNKTKKEIEKEKEELILHKSTFESSRRKKGNNLDKDSIKSNNVKKIEYETINYIVYQFLSQILTRIEIKVDNSESKKDFSFFVIPPVCFLLTKQSIKNFDDNVDRDSVHSKIINLIKETDYFICEMFFNNQKFRGYSKFSKVLSSINISTFEIINYIIIIVHNFILVINFYSLDEIDPNKKKNISIYNFYLSLAHIGFIIIVMIIWFYYFFRLEYIHNIMTKYNVNFCFREIGDKNSHFNIFDEDMSERINNISEKISFSERISTIIFDSFLMNRQVNMLIATLICLAFYLLTGSAIAIAVPVLFLANMIELLYGIFLTIKIRWSQLLVVLTYSFLIEYLFAIFAFYFFTKSFNFHELYNVKDDTQENEEQMCGSILQCYLTLLSYGGRSGGGIGDIIIKLAYNPSSGAYVARFFFDIFFHIIVVLIMTNLIFGIVVDSFAAFRNKTDEISADKNNVCFICQMTRDDAINKNIDFDLHRETVHNYWNYVYFLTYLHINNENNFKMLESSVWDKLLDMDTSWIPLMEDDKDEKIGKDDTKLNSDEKNNNNEKENENSNANENNNEEKKNDEK